MFRLRTEPGLDERGAEPDPAPEPEADRHRHPSDGRRYRAQRFLVKEMHGRSEFKHLKTELRALLRKEVTAAGRGA
ncbi:MAG: hypothetical protein ACE5LL_09335, partial [Alphaproteobacteria bacterium]